MPYARQNQTGVDRGVRAAQEAYRLKTYQTSDLLDGVSLEQLLRYLPYRIDAGVLELLFDRGPDLFVVNGPRCFRGSSRADYKHPRT